MNKRKNLIYLVGGLVVIAGSVIGYLGQNFNIGQSSPAELYTDAFASRLLLACALSGLASVVAAAGHARSALALMFVFLVLLFFNNPWLYAGEDLGYIENPWTNPALAGLIAGAAAINSLSIPSTLSHLHKTKVNNHR